MFADRRRLLMSVVAIAVLAAGIWAMQPAPPPPSASTPVPPRDRGQGTPTPPPVAPVKLDALTAARHQPGDTSRNPFRYQPKVVPPPPRPVAVAPPSPEEGGPPPTPAGPPPPPPIPLKFIGVLERANGVKWAVLSDGKNVLHGREGDIVDGRYRILKIGVESVEVAHADGRGRQVVRLTGQ
jgi:hypothetical protein